MGLDSLYGRSNMDSKWNSKKEKEDTFQVSNDSTVGLKTQLVLFVFSFPSLPSPFPLFPLSRRCIMTS